MRQFYKNVKVDTETLQFCAECEICKKKEYGLKIPVLCRSIKTLARCEKGKANKICRSLYNRAKANSTQIIAIKMNQCKRCHSWVCDNCFISEDEYGACTGCRKNVSEV